MQKNSLLIISLPPLNSPNPSYQKTTLSLKWWIKEKFLLLQLGVLARLKANTLKKPHQTAQAKSQLRRIWFRFSIVFLQRYNNVARPKKPSHQVQGVSSPIPNLPHKQLDLLEHFYIPHRRRALAYWLGRDWTSSGRRNCKENPWKNKVQR